MKTSKLLIYCTHGTYGRDDDAYGALLQANHAVARGMNVTLVLVEDGALLSKKGQNPSKIGLPNNLDEIEDFIELGGAEITPFFNLVDLIEQNEISLTF